MEGNKMSEKKIELPSGGWAIFKDPSTLKVKDRKKVFRNAASEEGLMQALSLVDGLLSILIKEWSFEAPTPDIKINVLDELSMADYDVLSEAAGEVQEVLFPNTNKTPETEADADSPFGKSKD
jgi:hypothetical protein